jgi:membrane associated rhomboid family serine protease
MAARLCPFCQRLNSEGEARCHHCGRRLPGPLLAAVFDLKKDILGASAPMTRLVILLELVVVALCVMVDRRLPIGLFDFVPADDGSPSGIFRGSTLLRFGALIRNYTAEEPFRLLSAGFVHANLLHVGMNLFMFAQLGPDLEHELGSARALLLFIGAVLAGSLASAWWYGIGTMVGASGGVFGQLGAFVGLLYAHRDPLWKRRLGVGIAYTLLVSLAIPMVDGAAHVGGFAAGAVLGFLFWKEQRSLRLNRAMPVLAGIALVSCAASVVLSARSPQWQLMQYVEQRREIDAGWP